MRKFLLFIGLMVFSTIIFAQATATLRLGSTDLTGIVPGQKIYVPINLDATSGDVVTGYQFFIDFDNTVLSWDGTIANPTPGVSYFHPNFPYSPTDYTFNNLGSTVVVTYIDPTFNGKIINAGEIFITFKFTYLGGQTELAWQNEANKSGGSSPKFLTEVYDANFTTFDLTLVNGCVCLPNFDATIHVTDGGTDLEGAEVTVNGVSILTDLNGNAVFNLPDGNYTYLVTKEGYSNKSGGFSVSGSNITIEVAMFPVGSEFDVNFVVTSGGNPLAGAAVIAGGYTSITNALGEATISLTNGNYNYTISKYGYSTENGSFTVADASQIIPVSLTMLPQFDIIFHITSDGLNIEDALVDIPGVGSVASDLNGEAIFNMIDGDYTYTVSKMGYAPTNGSFTVSGAAQVIEIELDALFEVTFHVTDNGVDLQGASVTIGSQTLYTNSSGIATFFLIDGNYDYLVTKLGYTDETGNFDVSGSNMTIEVPMSVVTYLVTFHVTNESGNNLDGATITIDALSETTDINGIAEFDLPDGVYFYSVIKLGFYEEVGTFSVEGGAETIDVTLIAQAFEVTFVVTSEGAPLSEAAVTIGSLTINTNAGGIALFALINGTYNYTVTKAGYNTVNGTVTVNNANITEPVSMIVTTYPITFHVTSDAGANLEGASVIISGQTVVTNVNGIAVFNLPNGDYSYLITKTGYSNETGSFTVNNAGQTIDEMLTLITYTVTFHAVGAGGALEGVTIVCQGQTLTTNIQGNATMDLPPGTYTYVASKPGYHTVNGGDFTIIGANVTENIIMAAVTATFVVKHNNTPVQGAVVTLEGYNPLTTPANGTVVFSVIPDDTYDYTVTHPDYGPVDGTITVANETNVTEQVILVGVSNISSSSFSIYPNPSTGVFNLTTTAVMGYESNITVYDLAGQLVYTGKLEGNEVNVIDLSAQEQGMYIMQIIVEDKVYNKTLIIQ